MSRLVNDIQVINQLLSQGITQVIGSVFSLVGILIAMVVLSVPLALVSFIVVPIMAWVTLVFAQRSRLAFRLTRSVLGIVSSELEEELAGVRVAQAFNRTEANIQHFAEHNAANRDANVHAVVVTSAFTPTIDVLSTLATAIVAAFGGWLAINHQIAVGTVVAFFIYVQQFFRPIQIISNIYTQMQSALAGAERIFDLVDEPVEQPLVHSRSHQRLGTSSSSTLILPITSSPTRQNWSCAISTWLPNQGRPSRLLDRRALVSQRLSA